MRKHQLGKFVVVGLLLFGGLLWQVMSLLGEQYPLTNFPPPGTRVVAFGDSLTAGVGASDPEFGYIGRLEERLHISIANKGVSGDTTASALARIDEVIATHPDITIVLLGGNDIIARTPRETTFANLKAIIAQLQKSGSFVIVIGVNGLLGDAYSDDFAALARETGSFLVPDVLDGILGETSLMSDQVHPNDAGYLKMADRIAPMLVQALYAAEPPTAKDQMAATMRAFPFSE